MSAQHNLLRVFRMSHTSKLVLDYEAEAILCFILFEA